MKQSFQYFIAHPETRAIWKLVFDQSEEALFQRRQHRRRRRRRWWWLLLLFGGKIINRKKGWICVSSLTLSIRLKWMTAFVVKLHKNIIANHIEFAIEFIIHFSPSLSRCGSNSSNLINAAFCIGVKYASDSMKAYRNDSHFTVITQNCECKRGLQRQQQQQQWQ